MVWLVYLMCKAMDTKDAYVQTKLQLTAIKLLSFFNPLGKLETKDI